MPESDEKPSSFKVTDRRRVEREPDPEPVAAPVTPPPGPPSDPASFPGSRGPRPPLDFTAFVLSFASTALVQMGAAPHPETGESAGDLELARETIDLLGMLREKTRGNLTDEETKFFDAVLYDLRVQFVEFSKPRA